MTVHDECGHSIFDACRDRATCQRQCSAKIEIPADRPMYSPWLLQAIGLATAMSLLLFVGALTAAIVERGAENWRAVALANQEVSSRNAFPALKDGAFRQLEGGVPPQHQD